jgi:hypothetical protein
VATLLAQFARDLGKQKEADLYRRWGGKPSTAQLRHRANAFNNLTLSRYHRKLAELVREVRLPTSEEEMANPVAADAVYESCGDYLRARTQDTAKYQRLFADNVNYGFRRNLWAMKGFAVIVAALCLGVSLLAVGFATMERGSLPSGWMISAAVDIALLACWVGLIRPDWVRLPAEAYARQLIASCEEIEAPAPASRIISPD